LDVTNSPKDRRLGRGLAALLGTPIDEEGNPMSDAPSPGGAAGAGSPAGKTKPRAATGGDSQADAQESSAGDAKPGPQLSDQQIVEISVYEIENNPFQPRREFNESEIASLAESLKEHKQLQPVLVRKVGDRFQLISGERRLRAAIHAGLATVRAEIREADDRLVAELAIIENLQRKDLNAIEKAMSFRRYIEQHNCTQDELGKRLKIDRSTVANMMRLLELPETVLQWVQSGKLSAGHGRSLLPLGEESQQVALGQKMMDEGWSVRTAELQVAELLKAEDDEELGKVGPAANTKKKTITPHTESLQQELRHQLGTKVEIRHTTRGKGKIMIHFANPEEFERLRALMSTQSAGTPVAELQVA